MNLWMDRWMDGDGLIDETISCFMTTYFLDHQEVPLMEDGRGENNVNQI